MRILLLCKKKTNNGKFLCKNNGKDKISFLFDSFNSSLKNRIWQSMTIFQVHIVATVFRKKEVFDALSTILQVKISGLYYIANVCKKGVFEAWW